MTINQEYDVIIVGSGFTGLTAGLTLSSAGKKVLILESDYGPGGLGGTFRFSDGTEVEKFYHHWFNNDTHVNLVVEKLGMKDQIISLPSQTGIYYNKKIWQLSSPMDLLKFSPLSLFERFLLGILVFRVRLIKNWKKLEHLSIEEWLTKLCGKKVYNVVWRPLVNSKFSEYAPNVSAVWMWKKLVLRGGSRRKSGQEELSYFKGGFGRLARAMANKIKENGSTIVYNNKALKIHFKKNKITALETKKGVYKGNNFLFTGSLPETSDILNNNLPQAEIKKLKRIQYLGNVCLVLQLTNSLSNTYWLNVNDSGFPFVGVIEHTNFDRSDNYKGKHIVYLSRYLSTSNPIWNYNNEDYFNYAIVHLKKMFPEFSQKWVVDYGIWRSAYAQPVTERNYSKLIPPEKLSFTNGYISTMAHIYPEDRGTNYAMRNGENIAKKIMRECF